jgi:PAS domain S-box-containing protein
VLQKSAENRKKVLLFVFIIPLHLINFSVLAQDSSRPNVLLLHSYHQQFKWTGDITQGVESVLEGKCNLQVQYMDTKRQFDEEYQEILLNLVYHKYKKHKYQVIISSDNNALDFLKKYHDTIFGNTPIVFCGVNYAAPVDFEGFENITGISEDVDIEKNFQLIKCLQPNAENLFIVVDETPTGHRVKDEIKHVIQKESNLFKTVEVTEMVSMAELEAKLSELPKTYAVLFTLFFRDSEDKYYSYGESARRVSASSKVPVFSLWDFYLNFGVVGGFMADGFAQGEEAAKLAWQIIQGKKAHELPIVWESPNYYKFDYQILAKFDIDLDLLPKGAKVVNEPYSLYKHDNTLFWQIVTVIIILSVLVILLIISSLIRRRLTFKVKNKSEYLSTLLNAVGEGLIDVDSQNRVKNMNPIAELITGYSEVEAIGQSLDTVFPIKKVSKGLRQKAYFTFTNRKDESYKVTFSRNEVRVNGKLDGTVIAFSDITKIIESEERFSRLTENARDVIYRISIPNGNFEYVSPAAKEILGYSPEELYQSPVLFKSFIPNDWKKYVFKKWVKAKKGLVDRVFEYQVRDRSGNLKWINQRNVLVFDHKGNPIALEGIMTDITEQKNIETQLRESLVALEIAKEKAEESDKLKSAFLANIAHEIRTPMNGIMGFSQLLRNSDLSDLSQDKYLNIIQNSSERMLNIIDDLVNIAQIESGQARSKIKEVRLDIFMRHMHDQFESKAEIKKIKFEQTGIELLEGKKIMVDHYKLDYTIRKLLSNAIKYTEKGSVDYWLNLESQSLYFEVRDTGVGISPENQNRIFERFVQADNTAFKAEEGAGLGLAIAQSFVEMLGGRIKIDSELGKGSVFSFTIPVGRAG